MLGQHDRGVPQQIGGGLVARDEQQRAEAEDFLVGQSDPVDCGVGQRRHQVLAGVLAAVGEEVGEVGVDRGGGGQCVGGLSVVDVDLDQLARPQSELITIGGGNAQQIGDHRGGQDRGEVGHEVRRSGTLVEALEQLRGHLCDGALQPGHPPGSERPAHQGTQLVVARRVHHDHHRQERTDEVRSRRGGEDAVHRGVRAVIQCCGLDIGVAAQHPGMGFLGAVHRSRVTQ